MKAAGFPQPEPEFGQVWYERNSVYVLGGVIDGELSGTYSYGQTFKACSFDAITGDIFAPTATDILAEMRDGWRLTRVNQDMFICTEKEALWGDDGCKDNPAEAAAIAWLSIHENKSL